VKSALQAVSRFWQGLPAPARVLLLVLVGLLLLVGLRLGYLENRELPDFAAIEDIDQRKAAFFAYLEPFVRQANREILASRRILLAISGQLDHGPLNRRNDRWVRQLAGQHGLELPETQPVEDAVFEDLIRRVDIIPPSMALAQAALESGWGTSRFARLGNNLFGIWCYEPGCGLVPRNRPPGRTYEVRTYRSPAACFADYIRNLNANEAYSALWQIRENLRAEGERPNGLAVANGLYRYSQEGWAYIEKVQSLIRSNQLQLYDDTLL